MIQARTWDMPDGGVGIELSGHAEPQEGRSKSDEEHKIVCAGASMLLVTLAAITNGTWGGDKSGTVVCLVPPEALPHAEFAVIGLMLLEYNYKGHIAIERGDSRLGVEWEQAHQWNKQQDEAEAAQKSPK